MPFVLIKGYKMLLREHINLDRDSTISPLGQATLRDRYMLPTEQSPQEMLMRASTAWATNEEHALRLYDYSSKGWFGFSTPTISNAPIRTKFFKDFKKNFSAAAFESVLGALPISCFTGYVGDNREEIGFHYYEMLWLASGGGGYKAAWSDLRPIGSSTSTGSKTGGLIPFFHVTDGMIIATHQGNNRRGIYGGACSVRHVEIISFIESRKMSGDNNKRSRNVFQTVTIPDEFMYAVLRNEKWELKDHNGQVKRTIRARYLWEMLLSLPFEVGCPFIMWEDTAQEALPQTQKDLGLKVRNPNICCMSKDERVVTDEGIVTVAELYTNQREPKVAGRGVVSQGSAMLLPRPDAPMVRVMTKEGYSHKVTPDHRIWVVGKGWVEAQHIEVGDKIELQTTTLFGKEHDPELALIAGLVAGDGTFSKTFVRVDLWKNKLESLVPEVEEAAALAISKYTYELTKISAPVSAKEEPKFSENEVKHSLHSALLTRVLNLKGFNASTKLKVPEFVWKGNKETVVAYLRGLFLTDATTQATDKGAATISLASIDKGLLEEVQILLINLGVISRISVFAKEGMKKLPDGLGGVKDYWCNTSYRLMITSSEMCALLEKEIGLGKQRGNSEFLKLVSKEAFRTKAKYQATFVGLEKLPNEDAYCLTVDSEDHAWTVNGLITHNTEITLATDKHRTAICCLVSPNAAFYDEWKDHPHFVSDLTEMLDNIIEYFVQNAILACTKDYDWEGLKNTLRTSLEDLGIEATEEQIEKLAHNTVEKNIMGYKKAVYSAKQERALGIGMMGLDSYFMNHEIAYESNQALEITSDIFKNLKAKAVEASLRLGTERGEAPDMVGTGRRNSHVLAVAPTATNADNVGCSAALEKRYELIYTKKTKSGTFEVREAALTRLLNKYNINTPAVIKSVKDAQGSCQHITEFTDHERKYLRTAFETDQRWIIEHAAVAQAEVCQAISVNLFIRPNATRKYVNNLHLLMWKRGLKTRYYIRSKALFTADAFADDMTLIETINYEAPFEECVACQ